MMKATIDTPSLRRKLAAALNGLATVPAKLAILAFPLLLGTSCTTDEPVTPATPTPGQQVTITASLGSSTDRNLSSANKPGTRMVYTPDEASAGLKIKWEKDDAFKIGPINDIYNPASVQTFTLTTGENTTEGTFSGTAPAKDNMYVILHPASIEDYDDFYLFSYTVQEQTGNDNRSHLTKFHSIIKYVTDYTTIDFSTIDTDKYEAQSSCMKFVLTPGAAITPTKITLASADGDECFYKNNSNLVIPVSSLSLNLSNFTPIAANGTITAYMMMSCATVTLPDAGITVTVDATDGSSYAQTIVPASRTQLAGGKMHTITAKNMTKVEPNNVMKLTVKVVDDVNGLNFNIPFPTNGITTPADITVDWGDESKIVEIAQGTSLGSTDNFNHPYGKAGTYTITITSSQTDATKQQIPEFNFYNRNDNKNCSKLISMDTPLLNTDEWSFASCFSGCTALTTIHAELFKNNPSADTFSFCFKYCTALTDIPAGLFDKNTKAETFSSCFEYCTALTDIPAELFKNNAAATSFSSCFENCTTLTTIPAGLFDNNAKATDFSFCFCDCTALTDIPAKLFDKNVEATNFNKCFGNCTALTDIPVGLFKNNVKATNFFNCFNGCTTLTTIPAGLFNNNVEATNFSGCFGGCTKLKLNARIFSTAENKDRFKNKVMNFNSCFYNVGNELTEVEINAEPASVAPDLWNYIGGGSGTSWDTAYCFKSGKFSNSNAIKEEASNWGYPAN